MNKVIEKVTNAVMKIAEPMAKFAEIPGVRACTMAMTDTVGLLIVGSIFMLLFVFTSPGSLGTGDFVLLPFLSKYTFTFLQVYQVTMNFIAFWLAILVSINYAELKGIDTHQAVVIGLASFLLIGTPGVNMGALETANFAGTGIFVALLAAVWSNKAYKWFMDKGIYIKLPDSVPPAIGMSFAALIPITVILTVAWIIRHIIGLDIVTLVNGLLAPLQIAADTPVFAAFYTALNNLLWSCGLHGYSMVQTFGAPIKAQFLAENTAAMLAGETILPHIFTDLTVECCGSCTFLVMCYYLLRSRHEHLRAVGKAAIIPAFFNIQEPLVFGIPLVFNGYLMPAWILSNIVGTLIMWTGYATNILHRAFATGPWAAPVFISTPLVTGDWKVIIFQALCFLAGLLIWKPFWVAFENAEEKRLAEEAAEAE